MTMGSRRGGREPRGREHAPPGGRFARLRSRGTVGLLGQFALISAGLVVLLGVMLTLVLDATIEARALGRAEQLAHSIGQLAVEPLLEPEDLLVEEPDPQRVAWLDARIGEALEGQPVDRVKLFNRLGTVAYSDAPELVGTGFNPSVEKDIAFAGEVASKLRVPEAAGEHATEYGLGTMLEVYVPVWMEHEGEVGVLGALELYFPYDPVAQEIAADERLIGGVLAGGLLVLWLGLFRFVRRASGQLRLQAEENTYLAMHDPLTGLTNRTAFTERAQRIVERAGWDATTATLLLIDIHRFKEVNDTLGFDTGDRLLRRVSERLQHVVREADLVARLGADEFGILLADLGRSDSATAIAHRILEALRMPFLVGDITIEIDASIGIASFPEDADDASRLLQCADLAVLATKRDQVEIARYRPDLQAGGPERLSLFGELRRALERDELVVHYQPQVDLVSGRVVGVEALVRWDHPERGLVPPGEFLAVAEQTWLIRPLTRVVLDRALRDCKAWRAAGHDLTVAVNLSSRTLLDANLPAQVAELLTEHDLPQDALELEITESAAMADPERALAVLDELHRTGIRLSVDDYGTGYSSLAYLSGLPVATLKIDRSFVMRMTEDPKSDAIVRSTVELGRMLGLRVVAEGVEAQEAYLRLCVLGCDAAQGFWLVRPAPADTIVPAITAVEARLTELEPAIG